MGLFTFNRDAGKRLSKPLGASTGRSAAAGANAAVRTGAAKTSVDTASTGAGGAIVDYIRAHNISASNLDVDYDAKTLTATVRGTAKDQTTREMIVLLAGNVHGVEHVDDQLQIAGGGSEPAAEFYTVKSGDSLSKIAKQFYGDANRYPEIFEANRPMLQDPDEIFPGQVLRVPGGRKH